LLLEERLLSCVLLFPVPSSATTVVILHLVHFRHLSVQARVPATAHASREPASTATQYASLLPANIAACRLAVGVVEQALPPGGDELS
jgi:hypothetical protein